MNGQHKRTLLATEFFVEAIATLFQTAISTQHLSVTVAIRTSPTIPTVRVPDFICSTVSWQR